MSLDSSKSVKRAKTLFAYRVWFLSQVRFSKLDTNNWLPLLAFRKCLMAGEVAPESSMVSVVPTEQGSEVMAAYGIRKTAWSSALAAIRQKALHTSLGLLINCPQHDRHLARLHSATLESAPALFADVAQPTAGLFLPSQQHQT